MNNTHPKPTPKHGAIKALITLLLGILLGILFFFGFVLFFAHRSENKIAFGVRVAGVDIGGLSKETAVQRLQKTLKYPYAAGIGFKYNGDIWHAIPEELGMQIQFPATVENAWRVGRRIVSPFQNLSERLNALLFDANLEPTLLFDERVAFNFITNIAQYIDEPLEQPAITIQGAEVIIQSGKAGKKVDRLLTMTMLHLMGEKLQVGEIDLPVTVLEPTAQNIAEQKAVLDSVLGQPFTLFLTDNGITKAVDSIPPELLAGWIVFQPEIDGNQVTIRMLPKREPLYNRLVSLGVGLHQEPQNARFIFNDTTKVIEPFEEAVVGKEIDIETTLSAIDKAIQAGNHDAEITMKITEPQVTSATSGAELGITELVMSQYTYFYGSSAARVQNITAGASSFQGLLIAPGETFSMAEHIGEINIDNGYAEAAVIYGGETIQGVGGGICQVSTTLFRAAFNYGLPITERHQHAYRVFYYERLANGNIDPNLSGMDASVYIPVLDLKFKNDTPYWILMETYVNPTASSIQWKFYSTKTNRYVDWKTTGPIDPVHPDPPLYRENSALPAGTVDQVDWEVDGASIEVIRTVYENGKVHLQDRFLTKYEPWQAVFEYGPGTPGMPPEK